MVMRKKKVSKAKQVSRIKHSTWKRVVLPKKGVVEVAVPKGVLPVVAIDPVTSTVEIVPVERDYTQKSKRPFWRSFFRG